MTINYLQQDVTAIDRGIVAHGCNCQGVMGSGVALAVRNKWPQAYELYKKVCTLYDNNEDMLGLAHFVTVEHDEDNEPQLVVANLITQHSFGRDGRVYADLDAIATSLERTFRYATETRLPVYMPRIGCGLGGLKWDDVGPVVEGLAVKQPPWFEVNVCDL